MTVYGIKIKSDIVFPQDFSQETETQYEVELSSDVPTLLKSAITCGFPLYWAHDRRVYLYSDRLFDESTLGQPWCYEVKEIVTFYWWSGESVIYYEFAEKENAGLLGFWFVHLFLPFYMTLENKYDFLHAGAVEVKGKPILFIAPSMGGKSTMTDFFIKQGHTLISDDKVPTFVKNGQFMCVGSHPYHRPYRKFEELGYRVKNFSRSFKPIHAFYALIGVEADADICISEVKGAQKFDVLYPNYLYTLRWLQPLRLKYLAGMLNNIRVFYVQVPWDMEKLGKVHAVICKHSEEIE